MDVRAVVAGLPGARRLVGAVRRLRDRIRERASTRAVAHGEHPVDAATPEVEQELRRLDRRSRRSSDRATGDSECVVTMTTHGHRRELVWVSLESIARGSVLPRRLILWLDADDIAAGIPRRLRRLQRRGLEIRMAEPGLRVHAKYHSYVTSVERHELPLVVADDDMIYPVEWLEQLVAASESTVDEVVAHRVHEVPFDGDDVAPYVQWQPCAHVEPSYAHLATGVSGTLLPIRLLARLRELGRGFSTTAPYADDIWLHAVAVGAGMRTRQVTAISQNYPFVPGTQLTALNHTNVWEGRNDVQIAATYTAEALRRMREDRRLESASPEAERDEDPEG